MTDIKNFRYPLILLLLIALVIVDGVLTEFVIGSGFGREANPFMLTCLFAGNFMWIKVIGAVLSAVILWDIHRRNQRLALVTATIFVTVYALIVAWNIACIFISGNYLQ
jgi:hypothetical protein